ncbi:MAG: monomethylamine:corrinoid methyltransferase [Syntrophaceae bacterium]|nr:monomethylamine:corrinoid methyltransferase [Syntrophaceae bacterium]
MSLSFTEIVDRAINTGEKIEVKDFDMKVFRETERLKEKYSIKFNKENTINTNDDMADRLFLAGKEFYKKIGTYVMDSKRIIKFTEKEIDEALNEIPGIIWIGRGTDKRIMKHRGVGDQTLPIIQGGVIGGNATEEYYIPLYQSIAQEQLVDSIYFDPPHVIEGRAVMHGSPLEIHSARCAAMWAREAITRAGRPGMHLLGGAGSAVADISTCQEGIGIRPSDAICAHTTSELKIDYDSLNKIMHTLHYNCMRQVWWAPVIGGFAGGAEGSAITAVGGLFHGLLVGQGAKGSAYFDLQVTPYYKAGATDRLSLWILSIAGQAIARNTKAILQGTVTTSAGPGTKMMLYEIGASAISQVVSGMHIFGVRIQKPTKENHGTAMESKWVAEVSRAAVNINRNEGDAIVSKLLSNYEHNIKNAPEGGGFIELYDTKRLTPYEDYLRIYEEVRREIADMGLPIN